MTYFRRIVVVNELVTQGLRVMSGRELNERTGSRDSRARVFHHPRNYCYESLHSHQSDTLDPAVRTRPRTEIFAMIGSNPTDIWTIPVS